MPVCISCREEYSGQLRRCPHCGEAQDSSPGGDSERRVSRARPRPGPRRRGWTLGFAVALGAGASVALALGWPRQPRIPEASSAADVPAESETPDLPPPVPAPLGPPDTVTPGDPSAGFAVTGVEDVGSQTLVRGTCSPDAVVAVLVNGVPAVLSPDATRFSVRLPARPERVDATAEGLDARTATVSRSVPGRTGPPRETALLLSHAEGQTVHGSSVHLHRDVGPRQPPLVLALDHVENVLDVEGRTFTLYRAPKGLVYLRSTRGGHRTFLREADGAEMVLVPAGPFRRGSGDAPPEGPEHVARLAPYLIDRTEVTAAAYSAFLRYMDRVSDRALRHPEDPGVDLRPKAWTSNEPPPGTDDLPVAGVSWYAAFAYARWVGGRLPSEAEWEKAAAGPAGRSYPWGDAADPGRLRAGAPEGGPAPADSYPEAEGYYGLLHASGNVREWCTDRFDPRWYARSSRTDPRGPPYGRHRVLRGGSYASPVESLRLQAREQADPVEAPPDAGFRVARNWDD